MSLSAQSAALTNMPADTALKQQRMRAWLPILDPVYVITTLLIIGASFVPAGFLLLRLDNSVVESIKTYDSFYNNTIDADLDCAIDSANENKPCTIEFEVEKEMKAPILLYYEIDNFYQNHREYTTSRDDAQLLGSQSQTALAQKGCDPLNIIEGVRLNPCGLIANTFFNDIIELSTGNTDANGNSLAFIEDGIAWQSDIDFKFKQPNGFRKKKCTSCNDNDCQCTGDWTCTEKYEEASSGDCYIYKYPNETTTQYLYETYPDIISPIEGVENEHFIVWMRVASKPRFRKLYGFFDESIPAGTKITFDVKANWDVKSFRGTKKLILTTTSMFGGKNSNFGKSFLGVGAFCLGLGLFFGLKHLIKPRRLAERKYLRYKEE